MCKLGELFETSIDMPNLVQTCVKGTKKMKRTYFALSDMDMWQPLSSKKPRQSINSLDKLLAMICTIKDLL